MQQTVLALSCYGVGLLGLIGVKVWNDDTNKPAGPTMQIIGDYLKKKDPKTSGYVRLGFLDAWISAMMATKAFEMVIDSGKPVNGDNLAAAMRSATRPSTSCTSSATTIR